MPVRGCITCQILVQTVHFINAIKRKLRHDPLNHFIPPQNGTNYDDNVVVIFQSPIGGEKYTV